MISAVYTPAGIVISTLGVDTFFQSSDNKDYEGIERIDITGHRHILTFGNRYALVYHGMNQYIYNPEIEELIQSVVESRGDNLPEIYEIMPYVKKQIMEANLNLVGVMAGYSVSKNGKTEPYVYQILGSEIRRINVDANGDINYNFVFVEAQTVMGRLLRAAKVSNGDEWEELPPVKLRCDLYSIPKAQEIAEFMLRTSHYLKNVNSSGNGNVDVQSAIITPKELIIK
ncbi:MAG: hypothetical protein ACI31F_01520 [Muribaculaceae bacterium]